MKAVYAEQNGALNGYITMNVILFFLVDALRRAILCGPPYKDALRIFPGWQKAIFTMQLEWYRKLHRGIFNI